MGDAGVAAHHQRRVGDQGGKLRQARLAGQHRMRRQPSLGRHLMGEPALVSVTHHPGRAQEVDIATAQCSASAGSMRVATMSARMAADSSVSVTASPWRR